MNEKQLEESGYFDPPPVDRFEEIKRELEQLRASYYELIMAVENKYRNESRHQAALRLIREAQRSCPECKP